MPRFETNAPLLAYFLSMNLLENLTTFIKKLLYGKAAMSPNEFTDIANSWKKLDSTETVDKLLEKEVAIKNIDLITEERRLRIEEMLAFNKRIDNILFLYISSVFAAIGLKGTGQFNLDFLQSDPKLSLLVFLFIFVNQIILFQVFASYAWSISLAKYVHGFLNKEAQQYFDHLTTRVKGFRSTWDDWNSGIKNVAVTMRAFVYFLWFGLVSGLSILSLAAVNVSDYFVQEKLITIAFLGALAVIQFFIYHSGVRFFYLYMHYHAPIEDIKTPKLAIAAISTTLTGVHIFCCIYLIVS